MRVEKAHVNTYLIYFVGMSFLFFLFALFRNDRAKLLPLSFIFCIFYILWGLLHHYFEGRLNFVIAMEYILFGTVAFLLFFTALTI